MKLMSLTIGILTLNEEKHIERCIQSAQFADQIIVIDSGSTDQTKELVEKHQVSFFSYPDWQGFGEQRNRLLQHVNTDYIFFLDADEVISENLAEEIQQAIKQEIDVAKMIWLEIAFGKPLKYFKNTRGITRLFKRSALSHFEGLVHENFVLTKKNPKVALLKNRLLHYSRESVIRCIKKLAQYAQLGAAKRKNAGQRGGLLKGIASANVLFFKLYFLRLGITGGGAGFLFCFFVALECFFRYAAMTYDEDLLNYKSQR